MSVRPNHSVICIYSMIKPITSIALMMLYEEGKLHLHEPVGKYIPEFAKAKVFNKVGYAGNELSDQQSPMTVHQLLTHTSGLTYGFFLDNPVEEMVRKSSFSDHTVSLEDTIKEIAQFPLIFQPGARWNYGVSTDG